MVIGTYMQPIATATERHGVPYFVISDVKEGQYKPYNLITIFPNLLDIYYIAVDLVERYQWRTVAVFYESLEGRYQRPMGIIPHQVAPSAIITVVACVCVCVYVCRACVFESMCVCVCLCEYVCMCAVRVYGVCVFV